MSEIAECGAKETDFAFFVAMRFEEGKKDALNVGIVMDGFGHGAGASVRIESDVTNGESKSPGGEAGFAKGFAGFLREMAQQGRKGGGVVGVVGEGVIVGDGFGFGVDDEFVGIAAAGFAIERGTPLAENAFEFLGRDFSELRDGFDTESAEGAFGDFTDAGDFSHG